MPAEGTHPLAAGPTNIYDKILLPLDLWNNAVYKILMACNTTTKPSIVPRKKEMLVLAGAPD